MRGKKKGKDGEQLKRVWEKPHIEGKKRTKRSSSGGVIFKVIR